MPLPPSGASRGGLAEWGLDAPMRVSQLLSKPCHEIHSLNLAAFQLHCCLSTSPTNCQFHSATCKLHYRLHSADCPLHCRLSTSLPTSLCRLSTSLCRLSTSLCRLSTSLCRLSTSLCRLSTSLY